MLRLRLACPHWGPEAGVESDGRGRQGTLSLRVKGTGSLYHTGRLLHHPSASPSMQWDKWLSETQTTDMERLLMSRERVAIRSVLLFEGQPRAAIKPGVWTA